MFVSKPEEGYRAPDFCLPEASEEQICLSETLERQAQVLIFYPTDFGITCTLEFKRFKEMADQFTHAGAGLIGISVNGPYSHRYWKEKLGLSIPLLSDVDAKISQIYNVMCSEDSILKGHSTRAIFVVDRNQIIRYRWVASNIHFQPDYGKILSKVVELRGT